MPDPASGASSAAIAPSPRRAAIWARAARLTGSARLRLAATEMACTGAPVDYARLAAIRTAIFDGSYHLDIEEIAEAMIRQGEF